MNLPDSLSRKAVVQTFDKIDAVAWERLFDREDDNGLAKLRVDGDYRRWAYYETAGLVHWMLRNAYYTPQEMRVVLGEEVQIRRVAVARTHLLVG